MFRLFVGNLPFSASQDDVRDHFSQVGEVVECHICRDRETGDSRGFAFVTMATDLGMDRARQMDKTSFMGRTINVDEAKPRSIAR